MDSDEGQIGVLSKNEALRLAKEKGKDLVLVAPTAKPPVAKILNFSNFKYQQKKKQKSGKTSKSETKELRFTPFIGEHDKQTRIKKGRAFLEDGDRLKINVKFVGRQMTRKEFGRELLEQVAEDLSEVGKIDTPPKMQGRIMTMTLKPVKNNN